MWFLKSIVQINIIKIRSIFFLIKNTTKFHEACTLTLNTVSYHSNIRIITKTGLTQNWKLLKNKDTEQSGKWKLERLPTKLNMYGTK